MPKAELIFTKFYDSYSVHVQNLEMLTVSDIQILEEFVKTRNGIFDFNTYTFVIQKKIEFTEFVKLLDCLHIEANISEYLPIVESKTRIGFGQYKGMCISDLADSYLLWLKSNYHGGQKQDILKEITKRGL